MNRLKSFSLLAVTLLAGAVGCTGLKTENFSEVLKQPLAADSTDTLSIQISIDYPVKGAPQDALDAMTKTILITAFDMEGDSTDIEATATRYETLLTDQYFDENASFAGREDAGVLSWEDNINGYFSRSYKNYDVYVIEYYSDRGGAHGMNTLTPVVFDRKTGRVVTESDLFVEGYEVRIAPLLEEQLRKDCLALPEDGADTYESLFIKEIAPNGCFDVARKGVTWYYQPYEIGPYYLGVIPVTLPWSALKESLR